VRIVALQAFGESNRHGPYQVRILSIGFFSAAPAGVAREIGVWTADDESTPIVALENVTRLASFLGSYFFEQRRIPRFAESGRLWKLRSGNRGNSGIRTVCAAWRLLAPVRGTSHGQAVQPFKLRIGTIGAGHSARAMNTEARNIERLAEEIDLFLRRHQREHIVDALLDGELGILEWVLILRFRLQRHGKRANRQPAGEPE